MGKELEYLQARHQYACNHMHHMMPAHTAERCAFLFLGDGKGPQNAETRCVYGYCSIWNAVMAALFFDRTVLLEEVQCVCSESS